MLLLLVLLVLGVSFSERAQAAQPRPTLRAKAAAFDPATNRYTGQRTASDPWLDALAQAGREFWASRGVNLPPQIALDVAEDLAGPDTEGTGGRVIGRGWAASGGDPRIALDAGFVSSHLRRARGKAPTRERRATLRELASRLLHEQGHVGGVEHVEGDEAGFMGSYGQGDLVPQNVARVVRQLVVRRPGEKARRGQYGIG